MSANSIDQMQRACRRLRLAFKQALEWQWDSRFETAQAVFAREDQALVRWIVDRHLPLAWNQQSIETSPQSIQVTGHQLGGLMPGQWLFTSDPTKGPLIYCAWWPWGDGETISIRLAPDYTDLAEDSRAAMGEDLRRIFQIKASK